MMDIYLAAVALLLVVIALIALLNALTFPRLRQVRPSALPEPPFVSVLVPARDESLVIAETVRCWLKQDYPNFELLLLDDRSSDGTVDLALQAAGTDPRIRILTGGQLPPGWKGKNWACHQLAGEARGEILVFTDADVCWSPGGLSSLVFHLAASQAQVLTVWPSQITVTWAERLTVPLMGFAVLGYLPALAVHHTPWPVFSAAIGQCLAFRRAAYVALGGHLAVREALIDDMALAFLAKRKRLKLRSADAAGLISARMYRSWPEVRDGFAKNILGGHRGSLLLLGLSTAVHLSLFLFPWVWIPFNPQQAAVLCALGILIRALTAAVTRQRVPDALLLPVSVALMTVIVGRAVQWHFSGGARWKGRVYGR